MAATRPALEAYDDTKSSALFPPIVHTRIPHADLFGRRERFPLPPQARCAGEHHCTAVEFALIGGYTRCEIHRLPVTHTFPLPG